jgi:hypothetical protein
LGHAGWAGGKHAAHLNLTLLGKARRFVASNKLALPGKPMHLSMFFLAYAREPPARFVCSHVALIISRDFPTRLKLIPVKWCFSSTKLMFPNGSKLFYTQIDLVDIQIKLLLS